MGKTGRKERWQKGTSRCSQGEKTYPAPYRSERTVPYALPRLRKYQLQFFDIGLTLVKNYHIIIKQIHFFVRKGPFVVVQKSKPASREVLEALARMFKPKDGDQRIREVRIGQEPGQLIFCAVDGNELAVAVTEFEEQVLLHIPGRKSWKVAGRRTELLARFGMIN